MKKISIHYTTLLFLFLSLIAGMFKDMLILYSIIIIHEIGHIIPSIIFKYKIKKINIYPYGGMIEYNEDINRPLIEDFIISISGIIMQSLYYFFICFLYSNYIIREYTFVIFCNYHFSILIFNMLPIYPLDGSKIANIIFNKFFPYKLSHMISILLSIIILIVMLIYNNTINFYLISALLIHRIYIEYKNHKLLFNKFLLERYINTYKFNKHKYINNYKFNKMYRDYNHTFIVGNKKISEKNALKFKYKIDL